ncbi:hypothetical protein [Rhodobacter calidifons]|uniref:Uncharacterized protein n=1 Tax=Rhodobacter calidifons TaxID=2715277 RepID=A0ABX0GA14_9RHOB|nr:hypothetical protein [Rhodobacter calidifons]NHB77752.1 hypothetical protein [Rhodobacter calidifons]
MSLPGRVALGTMHGKAAAIAPPLARLGIAVVVPEGLDTDRFGTFTGEVPRAGGMVEAARAKALSTMTQQEPVHSTGHLARVEVAEQDDRRRACLTAIAGAAVSARRFGATTGAIP